MKIFRQLTLALSASLLLLTAPQFSAADGPAASPEKEMELLTILRSDAAGAEKAIACKQLAIYGSAASVADLAKLLPDLQLSSWARIALENIPGPEVDEALRTATNSLEGRLLVGTINSIGVRRDAAAVSALFEKLKSSDAEVASAAAVALGRIGNAEAVQILRPALVAAPADVRTAVAEACVLCAERMLSEGHAADAIALYDEIRNSEVPAQRIIEATRGAILARGNDGIPLLLEQLQSPNKIMFQLALGTAREFPGNELDGQLAAELAKAEPSRAALIVQAMADRPETVVLAAVLKAAEQGPLPVRLSAINALARVGNVSCLPALLKIATEKDPELAASAQATLSATSAVVAATGLGTELAASAQATLSALPGDDVDAQIISLLDGAKGKSYPLLLTVVGKRRIEAVPALLKAVANSDAAVRSAALIALGETVSLKDLNVLVSQVVSPKNADDAAVAQQALKAASIRMADREACATQLAAAVEKSKAVPTKIVLLQILGSMGGTKALETIGNAAKSNDPQLQDSSSRLLGEWMTEDAAPVLLDLAKIQTNPYQVRAMRGYIRIARQFVLPDEQRLAMCQKAFDESRQVAEKKLVLDVLKRYPSIDGMKLAIKAMQVPELKDDATQATLLIAQKLSGKGVDVKELLANAGMEKMKLEIVKAEYGAGATQKDVTEILQKQVSDLPLISLESGSYNASFGGDPLPGSVKLLKVQYKINGKAAEASFEEDALIVLAMPK